jgi:hypothetical protein
MKGFNMNLDSKIILVGTPVSIVKKVNKQNNTLYMLIQFLQKDTDTGEVKLFEVKVEQSHMHNFADIQEGKQVQVEILIKTFQNQMFIRGIRLLKIAK